MKVLEVVKVCERATTVQVIENKLDDRWRQVAINSYGFG
jgi:hypothetical protein